MPGRADPRVLALVILAQCADGDDTEQPDLVIARCYLGLITREEMMKYLTGRSYTYGTVIGFDGYARGTWDRVIAAYHAGLLGREDLLEVMAAVGIA